MIVNLCGFICYNKLTKTDGGGFLMFLRKMKNKKTGRIYLSIVHSYRDKETKKTSF